MLLTSDLGPLCSLESLVLLAKGRSVVGEARGRGGSGAPPASSHGAPPPLHPAPQSQAVEGVVESLARVLGVLVAGLGQPRLRSQLFQVVPDPVGRRVGPQVTWGSQIRWRVELGE